MKPKTIAPAILIILARALLFPGDSSFQEAERPTPEQALWIEDVSPIISPVEREVFLKLRTNRERETFIRFFWRSRDATPDTSENEFRREYMERVRFADQNFGRESAMRGSQTDRGFYYLVLGPPLERQRFATQSELWPAELWFYKGEGEYGLPPYFYLVFFQPEGIGDYRLYSPGIDGPEKLVVPGLYRRGRGRGAAVDIIKKVNSELASASLSYFVGEGASASGALSSDNIIASVKRLPEKKYSDGYARGFLSFKDYVETEYSDRYLESVFLIKVFKQAGQSFIHWSIEPERMNFGMQDRTVYAGFELVLRMEDGEGKLLFERTEEIPLQMTPEQYTAHERQRFAFQDMIPAVPGEHKLLFLLKNKTGREFSSHETRLKIPSSDEPGFSSLLLHHGRDPVPEAQIDNVKAFTFAATGYPVSARNEFNPSEIMGIFLQVFHADRFAAETEPSFILEIFSLEAGKTVLNIPLTPEEPPETRTGTSVLRADIDLTSLKPGYYRAEVSALDQSGRRILTQKEPFIILSQPFPILPWVYSRLHPPYPAFEHLRTIGAQYFLAGEYSRARDVLSRALETREDSAARLLLAKSLYGLGFYQESLDSALPLDNASADREALKVIALDHAGLGDWNSALRYLERLMSEATEIGVLNLAAECHLNLGHPEKALPLLEKSLSLLPDQPPIRELRDKIKKRLGRDQITRDKQGLRSGS